MVERPSLDTAARRSAEAVGAAESDSEAIRRSERRNLLGFYQSPSDCQDWSADRATKRKFFANNKIVRLSRRPLWRRRLAVKLCVPPVFRRWKLASGVAAALCLSVRQVTASSRTSVREIMTHSPDFPTFRTLCSTYDLIPVYRRLVSDTMTPVTAFHRLDDGGSACLFESVIGGEKVGRYSFLAAGPYMQLLASGNRVTIIRGRHDRADRRSGSAGTAAEQLSQVRAAHFPELPPFAGGAVGYAGYDVVRYVENLPNAPQDDRQLPDMAFGFYDRMVVFDHVSKTMFVIATAHVRKHQGDARAAYQEAQQTRRPDGRATRLCPRPISAAAIFAPRARCRFAYQANFQPQEFRAGGREVRRVHSCRRHLPGGDQPTLQLEIHCDPFEIYRTLRIVNPSPFMFFLRSPGVTLVGSSPEIMCRVVDGKVTVRPLAGTRQAGVGRRGGSAAGRGTAGRSQGTCRACDAGRPGTQRRGTRRPLSGPSNSPT